MEDLHWHFSELDFVSFKPKYLLKIWEKEEHFNWKEFVLLFSFNKKDSFSGKLIQLYLTRHDGIPLYYKCRVKYEPGPLLRMRLNEEEVITLKEAFVVVRIVIFFFLYGWIEEAFNS